MNSFLIICSISAFTGCDDHLFWIQSPSWIIWTHYFASRPLRGTISAPASLPLLAFHHSKIQSLCTWVLRRTNKKGEFGPASIIRCGQFGCHREKYSCKATGQWRSRAACINPFCCTSITAVTTMHLLWQVRMNKKYWQMLLSLHKLWASVLREPLSATNSINIGERVAEHYFGLASTATKSTGKNHQGKSIIRRWEVWWVGRAVSKDWDLRSCSSVRGRKSKVFQVDMNNKGKWRRRNGSTCFCRNLNGT